MQNYGMQECFGIPRHQNPPRASITLAKRGSLSVSNSSILVFPSSPENLVGITPTFSTVPFGSSAIAIQVNEPGVYAITAYVTDSTANGAEYTLIKNPNSTSYIGTGSSLCIGCAAIMSTGSNISVPLNAVDVAVPGDFYIIMATGYNSPTNSMFRVTKVSG